MSSRQRVVWKVYFKETIALAPSGEVAVAEFTLLKEEKDAVKS